MHYDEFYLKSHEFFNKLDKSLSSTNFSIKPHWNIDHICYRVDTQEKYNLLKDKFSNFAVKLIESQINGRPITTFKLNKPLKYSKWKIDLLELPAPKKGKKTKEGFEHIEIVCNHSFDQLSQDLKYFPLKKDGLTKDFNQELACNINGTNLKFHHVSLESVVTLEANSKVFQSIIESKVLKNLKLYKPLVVGTYPLGLNTNSSDIDILLYNDDLNELTNTVKNYYKNFDSFNIHCDEKNNYIVISFNFENLKFELYAEKVPTLQQRALKHFQIEERLLKLGSSRFKQKIVNYRGQGLKTEPAFAKAMGLNGNSYIELLNIYDYSEDQLIGRFPQLNSN